MRSKWNKLALEISDGLLGTVIDLTLFQLFLLGSSFGKSKTSFGANQMIEEAHESLSEFNYQTIKNAFKGLKKRGFIRSLKEPEITESGRKKLATIIPFYNKSRVWDGSFYLVTYDVPEKSKSLRDKLRIYLKKIGSGKLQESVWLTVYNPSKLLANFVEENSLPGSVIVSCVGKDGYIGNNSLQELINEVYKIDELNHQYSEFVNDYSKKENINKFQEIAGFYKILQDDPQLPWDLLPDDWQGDKAYKIFESISKS